jgi:hypothetical protein
MKIQIGSNVKINPEIFGNDTKPDGMYGSLGYVGVLKNAIWKVERFENDCYRGACAWVTLTNAKDLMKDLTGVKEVRTEGQAMIILSDLVLHTGKITLDYVLNSTVKTKKQMLEDLFKERKVMKSNGMSRSESEMMENWRKIRILRGDIKGEIPLTGNASVYLPKQRVTLSVEPHEVPDDTEDSIKSFKNLLCSKLRKIRHSNKIFNGQTLYYFGTPITKIGGVFCNPNELLDAYVVSVRKSLDENKKPTDASATYVGIEVEFIYTGNKNALIDLLIKNKLHKNIKVDSDGSLRACHNSNYSTAELQIIAKTSEVEDVMFKLQKVMDNPLIDGYANRSCGTHIHLDMRNRNHLLVFKNLVRIQDILRGCQPIGRLNNTHCKANKSDEFGIEGNRYLVVNPQSYAKHSTMEVRVHEGTVDAKSIINWVKFLDAIASSTNEIPVNKFKTTRELVSATNIEIPLDSMNYVDSRIDRFQSLSVG